MELGTKVDGYLVRVDWGGDTKGISGKAVASWIDEAVGSAKRPHTTM